MLKKFSAPAVEKGRTLAVALFLVLATGFFVSGNSAYAVTAELPPEAGGFLEALPADHLLDVLNKTLKPSGPDRADASKFNGAVTIGGATSSFNALLEIGKSAIATAKLSDVTGTISNNALSINAPEYRNNEYFPGIVWRTQSDNPTKPKLGIWGQMSGSGSRMFFGTSNDHTRGITNTAMTIDESGRIGIGTSSPASLSMLEVRGPIATVGQIFANANDTSINLGDLAGGDGLRELGLYAGDQRRLTINKDTGNVGIGTTTPGGWFEAPVLEVSGARGTLTARTTAANGLSTLRFVGPSTGSDMHVNFQDQTGSLTFSGYKGGYKDIMTIAGNGTVGIGNKDPKAQLSVTPSGASWNEGIEVNPAPNNYNGIYFRETPGIISGTWFAGRLANNDAIPGGFAIARQGLGGTTNGRADTPFAITTAGTALFGGNVGIGVAGSGFKLDVATGLGSKPGFDKLATKNIELFTPQDPGAGDGIITLHHGGRIAHQLRYNNGTLYLEPSTRPDYGTSSTPALSVGGSVAADTLNARSVADAILNLQTADNAWLYTQWLDKDGKRKVWMGLDSGLSWFNIQPENGTGGTILGGSVGIGITPQRNLHVYGTTGSLMKIENNGGGNAVLEIQSDNNRQTAINFTNKDGSAMGQLAYDQGSNVMTFNTNGAQRMKIDQSGSVGIGTTSPGAKLDIVGDARVNGWDAVFRSRDDANRTFDLIGSYQGWWGGEAIIVGGYKRSAKYFSIGGASEGSKFWADLTSGNVGIGTTGPGAKLDVAGNLKVVNHYFDANDDGWLRLKGSDNGSYKDLAVGNFWADSHIFLRGVVIDSGPYNRFRICGPNSSCSQAGEFIGGRIRLSADSSFNNAENVLKDPGMGGIHAPNNVYLATVGGNVGIGTDDPRKKLHVNGSGDNGLLITAPGKNTAIALHVSGNDYGYFDLGGGTQLRGGANDSNFTGKLMVGGGYDVKNKKGITLNPDGTLQVGKDIILGGKIVRENVQELLVENHTLVLNSGGSPQDAFIKVDKTPGQIRWNNNAGQWDVSSKLSVPGGAIDNTSFKGLFRLDIQNSDESPNGSFNESKPSYGIEFRRKWHDQDQYNVQAGIYAWGSDSWSSGLAFRTSAAGPSIGTRMVITGGGNVGIGTADPKEQLHVNGGVQVGGNNSIYLGKSVDGNTGRYGINWHAQGDQAYGIFREAGPWTFPYPDLNIAFHTGIKLGANHSYGGVRFYDDWNMGTLVMSINDSVSGAGSNNVYIAGKVGIGTTGPGAKLDVFKTEESNGTAFLVRNSKGNNSWGIAGEFRVDLKDNYYGDRPSILFSSGYNNTTWSIGYGASWDDNFRIRQNHGYRNNSWGTERFKIDTDGIVHLGMLQVRPGYLDNTPNGNWTTLEMPGVRNLRIWDNLSVDNNVGIGTTDPSLGGKVRGRFTINSADDSTQLALGVGGVPRFALNTNTDKSWTMYDYASNGWTPGITQKSGNVGIGTASPGGPLHVLPTFSGPGTISVYFSANPESAMNVDGLPLSDARAGDMFIVGSEERKITRIYELGSTTRVVIAGQFSSSPVGRPYRVKRNLFLVSNSGDVGVGGNANIAGNAHITGNVGIGTTDPKTSLQIGDKFAFEKGENNYPMIASNVRYLDGNPWYPRRIQDGKGGGIRFGVDGKVILFTVPDGKTGDSISLSNTMTLSAAGDVGIGTLDPGTKLDVAGTIRSTAGPIYTTSPGGYAQTSLQQWGLLSAGSMYIEPAPGSTLYLTDQWSSTGTLDIRFGKTQFASGNVDILTGTLKVFGGNVVIGGPNALSNPDAKLVVQGPGAGGTIRVRPQSNGGETSIGFKQNVDGLGVEWVMGQNAWGAGSGNFGIGGNGAGRLYIQSDGDVGIGVSSPCEGCRLDVRGGDINVGFSGENHFAELPEKTRVAYETDRVGLDVAELFETKEEVEVGDIVAVADEDRKLTKSSGQYQGTVVGVVSGAPAILFEGSELKMGANPNRFEKGVKPPVALAGRIPVKVSLENGAIKPGDYLTSSSKSGVAMKATEPGMTIGVALESYDGKGEGKVLVFLNLGEKNTNVLKKKLESLERRLHMLEYKPRW